ncbi:MAG: hypothetical protein KDE46_25340 [Caldilineaceae bacterium]|nr:hypothetical protein [Caldilineaceae bacterium]
MRNKQLSNHHALTGPCNPTDHYMLPAAGRLAPFAVVACAGPSGAGE